MCLMLLCFSCTTSHVFGVAVFQLYDKSCLWCCCVSVVRQVMCLVLLCFSCTTSHVFGVAVFQLYDKSCVWLLCFSCTTSHVFGVAVFQLYDKINTRSHSPAHRPLSDAVHQAREVSHRLSVQMLVCLFDHVFVCLSVQHDQHAGTQTSAWTSLSDAVYQTRDVSLCLSVCVVRASVCCPCLWSACLCLSVVRVSVGLSACLFWSVCLSLSICLPVSVLRVSGCLPVFVRCLCL